MVRVPFPEKDRVLRCFGKVMRDCRVARGLSQAELSEKSHVDRVYIGHLEAGEHAPTIIVLWRLARVLEVSPSQMIQSVELGVECRISSLRTGRYPKLGTT